MANWSATQTRLLDELTHAGLAPLPRGVVLVAAPWNFPYAIPANGVCSALAGWQRGGAQTRPRSRGHRGPSSSAQLYDAGVPRDVVQLVRCHDDEVGRHLVTHDGIDTVVLTGAYETAQMFLDWKPQLRLIAETSGKNAIVITAGADLDLAIRDLVRSAFGHAGQKCSAASLAIVEAIALRRRPLPRAAGRRGAQHPRRPSVRPRHHDGSAHPVTRRASSSARSRNSTPASDGWSNPDPLDSDGRLLESGRPCRRTAPARGSTAPSASDRCSASCERATSTRRSHYRTTPSSASPADSTASTPTRSSTGPNAWRSATSTSTGTSTGAIVRRQPFGGWKHSSVGPGAKTGGPNDILRFVRLQPTETPMPRELDTSVLAALDPAGLRAEQNTHRYRPLAKIVARATASTTPAELDILTRAARLTGVTLDIAAAHEPDDSVARRLPTSGAQRLRTLGPITDTLARACHQAGITIDDTAATNVSRVELPRWMHEQTISRTVHRHGHLEDRSPASP